MEIKWYIRAKKDLDCSINYIAKQSPKNAMKTLDTLIKLTNNLIVFPFAYPKEPIYNKDSIRFIVKWSFKIIYRIDKDVIYILRVFNTSQHPKKIL